MPTTEALLEVTRELIRQASAQEPLLAEHGLTEAAAAIDRSLEQLARIRNFQEQHLRRVTRDAETND